MMLVTNQEPNTTENTPTPMLELFRAYVGPGAKPFEHQAQAWQQHMDNKETCIVAGTASGKTLAEAVPLFYKLFHAPHSRRIHHALWMYPTVALLDDQRRVLEGLATKMGLQPEDIIGQLQGGMSRTELIRALSRPVILATPDEVYWFFRKNVKYSGLLIYGLTLIDDWVLDEAHLFNGLMLRNFEHLWQRVKVLATGLGKIPRLHVLTATPTEGLKQLSVVEPIQGRSKCRDVQVEFLTSGRFDRADSFVKAVDQAIEEGHRKVLLVCNSARMAHQLFEKHRVSDATIIPVKHRLRFGRTTLGSLTRWLDEAGVEAETIEALNQRLFQEENIYLNDLPSNTTVNIPLEHLSARIIESLERACWRVKRALREQPAKPGESLEALVHNSCLPCQVIAATRPWLAGRSVDDAQGEVDKWLTEASEAVGAIQSDPVSCSAKNFTELITAIRSAGFTSGLADTLARRLRYELSIDPSWISGRKISTQELSHRTFYLRWLDWAVEKDKVNQLREIVQLGLELGKLEVECRHIGLWRGTEVPVVIYTGSIAKRSRKGLIDVFADLDRAVLVATSAVEVGVDFQTDVLITEECEGSSFLQRFGRVGRHSQGSKVIAFVSDDVIGEIGKANNAKISREEFSDIISAVFPRRNYAATSQILDASHYLVNEQLGRIGERLNTLPKLTEAKQFADKMRATGVQLSFGLRGTMPQITLRDGIGKDPFYLLRYVDDFDLRTTDSPFEVAKATLWFTSLVFQRAKFDITVDLEESLKASQHIFLLAGDRFDTWSRPGAGSMYLNAMIAHFEKTGRWTKWHEGNFLLVYGDIYLSRIDREIPHPEPVRDCEGSPLFIPNQTYLVLFGWKDRDDTRRLLEDAGIADWEELHYDWDRLAQNWSPWGMVILETMTGACFAAYKELKNHVGRQIQE